MSETADASVLTFLLIVLLVPTRPNRTLYLDVKQYLPPTTPPQTHIAVGGAHTHALGSEIELFGRDEVNRTELAYIRLRHSWHTTTHTQIITSPTLS